jgi:predicted ATPase
MTQPRPDSEADVSALLAAAGITVTDEGKARARRRLAEARQRWTLERWARLREQLGLPPRTA